MKNIFLLKGFVFCLFFSHAQVTKIAMEDTSTKVMYLDEITVSATRFAEHKKYLAQQVMTVNASKIALYNQQTAAELLTHTGSVLVQKSQLGGGSPIVRGFEANKILLVVDGVRMNNAIFRGGHLQNIITMDNSILEKTEVLFGPSSVMYGSDALGGVISFYTKKPALSTTVGKTVVSGNAFMRYSSAYNEKTGHADINTGGNNFASLTSFTFSDFGNLKQGSRSYKNFPDWGKRTFYVERINGSDSMIKNSNVNKQVPTMYSQFDLLQKFLFISGKLENVLNFQYSTSSDIYRYDRLTETNGVGIAKNAEWYYGPQNRLLAAWSVNMQQCHIFDKAQITTAYQHVEESRHNRNFRSANRNHRNEKIHIGSLNADFFKTISKFELGYGAEITYNDVASNAYAEDITSGVQSHLDSRYPDGGSNTQSYAVYAAGLYKATDKLTFNAGARFSHNRLYSKFNDKTFFPFPYDEVEQLSSAITGNASIVFRPALSWKISALISSGFRIPNVDDMSKVFESGGGTLIVPNPNIKPEKTLNYEVSITKTIQNRLQAGITLWYTDYHNALSTDFSTFNGSAVIEYNGSASKVVTVVNKNAAYVWGLCGSINAVINSHFSFSSMINYTYGRIKEDPKNYPLDHVAPLFGKISAAAKFGKFNAEVFTLYNGVKDSFNYNLRGEDNQQYSADAVHGFTPSWATLNIRAAYEMNKYATVQFALENIFDKYYRVFASGLSAPGRNFVITMRARL